MSMTPDPATRWLVRPRPNPRAALRLVCFPYAGGSATVFRTWPDALPPEVELLAVALPGRDARAREPRFDRLTPLVASLADAIGPELVEYFLPIVRADIAVSETETIGLDAPLSCPITVMGGAGDDRVTVDELDAWRAQTRGPFEREMYPGSHFFLHSDRDQVLGSLSRRLTRAIAFAGR
jgi:surfactin synthase thioesterase subunit